MRERIQKAVLHSAVEPTEAQKKRFEAFLRKKYGQAAQPTGIILSALI